MRSIWPVYVYSLTWGIVLLAFLYYLIVGEWQSAFSTALIFGAMLLPTILQKKFDFHLPRRIDATIGAFIFFSVFLGSLHNYYEKYPWWDGVLHLNSGLLLGIVGFLLVYILNTSKWKKVELSPGFIAFFGVCFSLAMSVVWEVYEYLGDMWWGFNMQEDGLPDTMSDLIVNMVGSIIIAIISYIWMRREKKILMTSISLEEK